jgi:mRNA interferase HigB
LARFILVLRKNALLPFPLANMLASEMRLPERGSLMRTISVKPLREFWKKHANAEEPLKSWYRIAERAQWRSLQDVRAAYGSADRFGQCYVFNICHNEYRLIVKMSRDCTVLLVCVVLTHRDYDFDTWKKKCRCKT